MHRTRKLVACMIAGTALTAVALDAAAAQTAGPSPSAGMIATRSTVPVAPEDSAAPLSLTVWLKLHDSDGLARRVASLYDPTSPSFHRWMTKSDLAAYLPTDAEVTKIVMQLRQSGISTARVTPDNLGVQITASTAQMEALFHTRIDRASIDGQVVHVAASRPQLAGSIGNLFEGLGGVDSVPAMPLLRFPGGSTAEKRPVGPAAAASAAKPVCFTPARTVNVSGVNEDNPSQTVKASIAGLVYGQISGATFPAGCTYMPENVRRFYGLNDAYAMGLDGTGQTIVIIDAFLEPQAEADGNAFNGMFGLPAFGPDNFMTIAPDGGNLTGAQAGERNVEETDLDVEWAHATAPGARIALVQAFSSDEEDFQTALLYAVDKRLGNVVSLSFGGPEALTSPTALKIFNTIDELAAAQGISVQVASGDDGDDTPQGIPADVNGLASSPFDTSVGGTSIASVPSQLRPVTMGWGNTANDLAGDFGGFEEIVEDPPLFSAGFMGGSGGGSSRFFAKPAYQAALPGTQRLQPDVSTLADPFTGVEFVSSDGGQTFSATIGGTSLASPIFTGIWAIVNQAAGKPVGQAAPFVAAAPATVIRDVVPFQGPANATDTITDAKGTTTYTSGQLLSPRPVPPQFLSAIMNINSSNIGPFYATMSFGTDTSLMVTPGWDDVTGYGTPDVAAAVRLLKRAGG